MRTRKKTTGLGKGFKKKSLLSQGKKELLLLVVSSWGVDKNREKRKREKERGNSRQSTIPLLRELGGVSLGGVKARIGFNYDCFLGGVGREIEVERTNSSCRGKEKIFSSPPNLLGINSFKGEKKRKKRFWGGEDLSGENLAET